MENSNLFIRGQVWYWDDPIYGRKENNSEVSIGEATLRYNRYCVISQTTDTIDSVSVLVIPCSSSNHTSHDVPIPLAHLFHDNFTYARTKLIFPVHPKFLVKYICTLPDSIMKQIEAELIKMMIPSVASIPDEELVTKFNLDLHPTIEEPIISKNSNLFEINVRSFIKDHLVISDADTTISSYELKDAFDQYCIINKLDIINDIVEFLEIFTRVTNNIGYQFQNKQRYNNVEFKGLKIRGKLKLSIIMGERDLINNADPQRPGRWDDESINEFLTIYDTDGIDAASEKFGLKQSTASNYWYKWKDRKSDNKINIIPRVPSTTDTPRSISKVANMIRDRMKVSNDYEVLMKHEKFSSKHLDEESFYSAVSSAVYYSLLDLLSIRKDDSGKFFIPVINENSKYLQTWHFFDKVYHDRRISVTKDLDEMLSLYYKYFPNYCGVDPDWMDKIKPRIENKLNLTSVGVTMLQDMIKCGICKMN